MVESAGEKSCDLWLVDLKEPVRVLGAAEFVVTKLNAAST
jgi:hypothetical protein